jgi:hypothetical protein
MGTYSQSTLDCADVPRLVLSILADYDGFIIPLLAASHVGQLDEIGPGPGSIIRHRIGCN